MYKDPIHLIKRAKLESTNPLALKNFGRVGEWAARNPYMLGGLGLGVGALGAGAMMRDKNESGPGMLGTLATLGLLGGGGYLLDRVGGFQGLGDGLSFYNRFAGEGGPGHGMSWGDKLKLFNAWSDMSPELRASLGGMKGVADLPGIMVKHPKEVAKFTTNYPGLAKKLTANTAIGGASTVLDDTVDTVQSTYNDVKAKGKELFDKYNPFNSKPSAPPVAPPPVAQPPATTPPAVPPLDSGSQSYVTP